MKKDTIYHYCNEFVFNSIIENKKIWLSDINKMNDSLELKWARDLFVDVLRINRNSFKQDFRYYIISTVIGLDGNALPAIGCFSKSGDLLSQWRAYADDGKGISLGFSISLVYHGLGVNINHVVYNKKKQSKFILDTLLNLHQHWLDANEDFDKIDLFAQGFAIDLNYLKNPAFFEEKEIRIVRLLVKGSEEGSYIDIGGNSTMKTILPLDVKIRKRGEEDIIYVELPLDIPKYQVIKEVILGPKCEIDEHKLKEKLMELGLPDVKIKNSKISYR